MPVIIPVDYCQANVIWTLDNDAEPIVNTFGLHCTDEAVIGSALADAVMLEWGAAWAGPLCSVYTITQVVLYGFNGLGPSEVFTSTEDPIPMTNAGQALPQNCAGLVRKRTDAAGRRGRGRFYLPGLNEAAVDYVGRIEETYLATLQTNASALLAGLQGITGVTDVVILHRSEGAGVEPAPTPVQSFTVEPVIATQRRRLRK